MGRNWWRAAAIRAIRTVAQTAAAMLGTGALLSGIDWRALLSAAAMAGLLSFLTSLAGLPEAPAGEGEANAGKSRRRD